MEAGLDHYLGLVIAFVMGGLVATTWLAMNPRAVRRLTDWLERRRGGR